MNIVAILSNVDAYFKEAPLQELDIELQKRGFHVIYPSDAADLLKVIENNPRICGVIFDWDKYGLDCAKISVP